MHELMRNVARLVCSLHLHTQRNAQDLAWAGAKTIPAGPAISPS
jgi:hypothetical protein